MPLERDPRVDGLTGHALRNARLLQRSLERSETAPPLARLLVRIRVEVLGLTRLEVVRRSGISRGTLRDLELGLHTPTRRILQQLLLFCEKEGVPPALLEQLRQLYAGAGETLAELLARLQLKAGSPRELARRVGISAATLWEYRRGRFPLPLSLLQKMCQVVDEDPAPAEALWRQAERARYLERGYPAPLAELWMLCARKGYTEKHLARRGLRAATLRRMRYLESPTWEEIERIVPLICETAEDRKSLQSLLAAPAEVIPAPDEMGVRLRQLRKQRGVTRRELADLFGIKGKKPARIIKYIEEDGFYSTQAFPAGLVALLVEDEKEQDRLLTLWRQRREVFHQRHRPEMRIALRLAREQYGFAPAQMEEILGYTSQEYQRIERGVSRLSETARDRIVEAIHRAGKKRIEQLRQKRLETLASRAAWRKPRTTPQLISLLARREGGLIPLARYLRDRGLRGLGAERLRRLSQGKEICAWCVLQQIGDACSVEDLSDVQHDWETRYRTEIRQRCPSPLGVEIRLLVAEQMPTVRAFSARLRVNYSVLIRNLQRIDQDEPIRWQHVERILLAAGLCRDDERWRTMHALWYTASDRRKKSVSPFSDRTAWRSASRES